MYIIVVSDTHGRLGNLRKVFETEAKPDLVLHLGDVSHDEEEIRELAGCTVTFVRGNCDWFSREPDTRDFKLGKHRVHMEHGHNLPDSLQSISYKADQLGAHIMLSGQTHRPMLTKLGDTIIANPGSISEPRQADGVPTYLVMEVDKEGEIKITPKQLHK